MLAIKTHIEFDREKPQVQYDMTVSLAKIWDRLKFAYQIVFGSDIIMESIYIFKNTNEIKDVISVLSSHIPKETLFFNVEKTLPEAILPTKAHSSDVGWDLYTPIDFRLNPGEMRRINFGVRVEITDGYYIQAYSRSGTVWKYNTMMALGVGVIDTGYRGDIICPFYNFGTEQMQFQRGDRIAQMVIRKYEDVELIEGRVETDTDRGNGGFGSSGK